MFFTPILIQTSVQVTLEASTVTWVEGRACFNILILVQNEKVKNIKRVGHFFFRAISLGRVMPPPPPLLIILK